MEQRFIEIAECNFTIVDPAPRRFEHCDKGCGVQKRIGDRDDSLPCIREVTRIAQGMPRHLARYAVFELELGNATVGAAAEIAIDQERPGAGRAIAEKNHQALHRLDTLFARGFACQRAVATLQAFEILHPRAAASVQRQYANNLRV